MKGFVRELVVIVEGQERQDLGGSVLDADRSAGENERQLPMDSD